MLIEKEDAIKALEEFADSMTTIGGSYIRTAIKQAIIPLPDNGSAAVKWIKCAEMMPPENEMVWVTIAGHDLIVCMEGETLEDAIDRISKTRWVTHGFLGSDGWYGADGYPMMVRPIAWMPLEKPKAYEGEV